MFYLLNISSPEWKNSLPMHDKNYLPVVPIFQLISPNKTKFNYFEDALTYGRETDDVYNAIKDLNERKNVSFNIQKIKNLCENENDGKACLCYGRIHEFGSYNISENITTAFEYYKKALNLNEKGALPMLSFYHRYFSKDIEESIIEEEASLEYIESSLPTSIQHFEGKYRPQSCPASAEDILVISEAASTMNDLIHHTQQDISEEEYERLLLSNDAKDLYKLAVYKLSEPYPDRKTIKEAIALLNKSYSMGYTQSGPSLARMKIMNNENDALPLVKKYAEIDDPIANFVMSEFTSATATDYELQRYGLGCLKKAVSMNSLPAINKLAELTYYGLLGISRSAKEAFKIYTKGAILGYKRSIFKSAVMLLGGDGVTVDCPRSIESFRKIIDLGPWSTFLDKYVERGSEIAYLKMIDLGLTPCRIIHTNLTNGYINERRGDEYLNYIRKARNGDDESFVWLALNSPLSEAEEYLSDMKQLKITSKMLEIPMRLYLILKNIIPWMKGELSIDDAEFISAHFKSLKISSIFIAFFITFMLLVISRVKMILE